MASLFLIFVILFIWRNDAASQEISIVFNHVLNYSIEATVIVAMLYIYIKIFNHVHNIIWTFKAQLIHQGNAFTKLFLFFNFLFSFKLSVWTVNIGRLFIRIRLNILDFYAFYLVVRRSSFTFSNLQRIFLRIYCI